MTHGIGRIADDSVDEGGINCSYCGQRLKELILHLTTSSALSAESFSTLMFQIPQQQTKAHG